ncbi:hypothetical protein CROQUDRAFT_213613 [Cronartium quercuum f. sp. fusiforme G11]|uniref:Uncharacterized protein n=1 Tax=Cronartium quercuum f. sp. fusiforme G11 TaxID=708437 RepID=A0A9P6NVJ6_9BASI|nr:hypothetical protein CROQUDRAFT_213613 [Cronartium quercuum f. sp. fusiforme G11]
MATDQNILTQQIIRGGMELILKRCLKQSLSSLKDQKCTVYLIGILCKFCNGPSLKKTSERMGLVVLKYIINPIQKAKCSMAVFYS